MHGGRKHKRSTDCQVRLGKNIRDIQNRGAVKKEKVAWKINNTTKN